jgi:hypothetical protein
MLIGSLIVSCGLPNQPEKAKPKLKYSDRVKQSLAQWQKDIGQAKNLINNGDLIMRAGLDVTSASLRNFNQQDKTYSHSGIAFIENGEVYVYHSYTGEDNPTGEMQRVVFDSFCNPYHNNSAGIYRYDLSNDESAKFDSLLLQYYKAKLKFDKKFNLKDDSEMYCAEVIYKGLLKATNKRITLPTTTIKNFNYKSPNYKGGPLKEFEYVALDNLYLNPHCKQIKIFSFDRLSLQDFSE